MSITDLTTTTGTAPGPKAYTVGMVDDVPLGEGRTFVVAGEQVAVFRLRDGSLHATQAACPHAGGPLADGLSDVNVLVEDGEGIVADLDAGIQRSIDAYTDPWGQDAKEPATTGQFRPSLPLIALPKVPVR